MGWIVRGLLIVAGFVASWLVAKDSPQFGIMQGVVTLVLVVLIVWILAFCPERWTHMSKGGHKPR